MSAVIDASVLVAALADSGPAGLWAEGVLAESSLAAPSLVLVETANILRRLQLARKLTPLEASSSYRDLLRLEIELFPFEPFAERVWELRTALTSYDAWYVSVAEALDLPLATLDRRITRAKGPLCEFMLPTIA